MRGLGVVVAGAIALLSSVHIGTASAAAYVDVRAIWHASVQGALPAGVVGTCFGDGGSGSHPSCGDEGRIGLSLDHPGDVTETNKRAGGIRLVNTTGHDIDETIRVVIGVSAFNPGGNSIGAWVDDPLREFAEFQSRVETAYPHMAMDMHGCATSVATPACGVGAPDSSFFEFYIYGLDAGESVEFAYTINLFGRVAMVPEPATVGLLGLGLVGFGLARRRLEQRRA